MGLLLPWLAALVSLVIPPGWSFYFDVVPKVVLVLAGAAIALWLPWVWADVASRRVRWLLGILAAQAFFLLAATAFSTDRWFSFHGSTWRRSGLITELAVLILTMAAAGNVAGRLRVWLRILILAGLLVAIYSIFQYFGVDPLMNPAGYRFGEGRFMIVRPPGTFGHAAYLATYLLFVVFGGAALARLELATIWKWIGLGTCGVAFFAIVLSGTRAALVGLAAGILFIAVRERVNRKWLAGAAALLVLLAGFYVSPAGGRLRARVFWSSEDALGGARLLLWRDALRMSAGRWAIGYGPETFAREFPRHQSIELARTFPDTYQESPHNMFIDALDSEGVGGLAALVALAALGLSAARGAMGGAFVAMLVSQQFTSFTIPTELYFYLCVAILVGGAPGVVEPRRWIGRVLAIPFAGFALYVGWGDLLLASARRALDHGQPGPATRLVAKARERDASADEYFSRRFLAVKIWPDAIVAAAAAPKTADDPQNALVNLAAFEATANDAAGVEQTLRQAIAAAPNWYKPHYLLAQVLELGGRMAEAKVEAQAAADRDGGKHPEVQGTLERIRSR